MPTTYSSASLNMSDLAITFLNHQRPSRHTILTVECLDFIIIFLLCLVVRSLSSPASSRLGLENGQLNLAYYVHWLADLWLVRGLCKIP